MTNGENSLRQNQVKLYREFISLAQSKLCGSPVALDKDVASTCISIKVSPNCSCGRFFEQHPTFVEETEGERLEVFLQSVLDGHCKCITASNQTSFHELQEVGKGFLHVAASLGLQPLVKQLVEEVRCDINETTSVFHFTALSLAVMQTKVALVQWLSDQPEIQMNIKSKNEKHTPLIDAMLAEKFLLVDILTKAKGVDLNATNFRLETPLVVAVRMSNIQLVRQLLRAGADHTVPAPDGTPPLLLATRAGREIVKEFVEAQVPLNVQNHDGETALTFSVRNRTLDVTDVLVQGGANPNENPALPCFVLAASLGLLRTMIYLWETGQNPNIADSLGWTALHFACLKGFSMMAQLLLHAGAQPDCIVHCEITPIGLAVFNRHTEIAEALLSHKCAVNVFDADLDTPLHYAAVNGDTDLVRNLLDHGANACSFNRVGATPLFNAAVADNTTIVKMLLPHYVDTCLHCKSYGFQYESWDSKRLLFEDEEKSVLWVAAYNGNVNMVSAILYAGFNAFREEWIHDREFPEAMLLDEDASLITLLIAKASEPCSLLSLCRCLIREIFGPGKQRKANQINGLPRKMKNYIMLRDIDDI